MKSTLILVLWATVAIAGFLPNVRVDHEDRPTYRCLLPAITIGPSAPSSQPLYVAFEDDSTEGWTDLRADIMFQKSTDAGRTWLPADLLIRRGSVFAKYPDIATDSGGNTYIVYVEGDSASSHVYCVSSSDGGSTWTAPIKVDNHTSGAIGWARIAADSAGGLFVAWNMGHIFSSVSTDRGATWSPRVRVDDDTVREDCYHADVFVQPGTNHYLVAATAPYHKPAIMSSHSYLYRSTDMGRTFVPGVQLDTFDYYTGMPHVVADREHIICDYTGRNENSRDQQLTEARTLHTQPDTWGRRSLVTDLDTLYQSYYNGAKLALSADGRLHTALMVCNLVDWQYSIYYASSTDFGASWSDRVLINDDTVGNNKFDPDICAGSAGHAYVVWQDDPGDRAEIWFSTNDPAGVAEGQMPQAPSVSLAVEPNIFRGTTTIHVGALSPGSHRSPLFIYDASGRLVRSFALPTLRSPRPGSVTWNGSDDLGRRCAPGAYLVCTNGAVAKVILMRTE
jgi:hypothetical protein